jgi:glycosyltransferase involved in cell wall biosynthesis
MKISVVIPCYKSRDTISRVVEETIFVLKERKSVDYEIILVDDGSSDGTLDIIKLLCSNVKVKGISLARNYGQPCASLAGFAAVSGDIVVYSDDDGQTPIDYLWQLVDRLQQGSDIVFAQFPPNSNGIYHHIGTLLNNMMANILIGKPKHLHFGNFWVCQRFVINEAIKYKNPYPYLGGIFVKTTQHISEVPTNHRKRLAGRSNYSLRKMVSLWLNGFTAFSILPLRISTCLGLSIAICGFIFAIYITIQKLLNPAIAAGYSTIMAAILIMGGLIVSLLGVVGEYVGRIYMNVNGVPQYVVRETLNIEKKWLRLSEQIYPKR